MAEYVIYWKNPSGPTPRSWEEFDTFEEATAMLRNLARVTPTVTYTLARVEGVQPGTQPAGERAPSRVVYLELAPTGKGNDWGTEYMFTLSGGCGEGGYYSR